MAGAAERGHPSAARQLPAVRRPDSRWLQVRPPRIAQALAVLALGAHAALWGLDTPFGRSTLGGAALLLAGIGWMVWAWRLFRQSETTIRPTGMPRALIDEGPYRFGRNPMYLGMAVALLGVGLALGAPFMAAAAIIFVTLVTRVHIPHEEATLRRAFGGWYSDYAATVRRWL
jgi:protein-S-isoprenylcysteine O-methyltransferase Ste14